MKLDYTYLFHPAQDPRLALYIAVESYVHADQSPLSPYHSGIDSPPTFSDPLHHHHHHPAPLHHFPHSVVVGGVDDSVEGHLAISRAFGWW
jgi:hypothetical protein